MIHTDPGKRHEFVLLFDVKNGNPNGDPDTGNLPRVDTETMHGLVTDVAIKRKIRDYIALTQQDNGQSRPGFGIFVQSKTALNTLYFRALRETGIEATKVDVSDDEELVEWLAHLDADDLEFDSDTPCLTYAGEASKEKDILDILKGGNEVGKALEPKLKALAKAMAMAIKGQPRVTPKKREEAKSVLCRDYFDIRMFGAVLTAGTNAGQVRGPVQCTFSTSLDHVFPQGISITRVAITKEADRKRKRTEMGRKPLIAYGLYRAHGYFNPFLAKQDSGTGVRQADLEALWEALTNLFEFDRSAARGEMAVRGLWVFSHDNEKGNAPAHKLFKLVKTPGIGGTPRSFEDYEGVIEFPENGSLEAHGFPGVHVTRLA